ncbi:hypothetical protein ABBQ38_007801 [Trebouxia sp. C0009 RCD-2024]
MLIVAYLSLVGLHSSLQQVQGSAAASFNLQATIAETLWYNGGMACVQKDP